MIRDNIFLELRDYWAIFRRRWPLVVLPMLTALILGVLTFSRPQSFYTVGLRYIVSQPPTDETLTVEQARRWSWVTSQFVVNSITDWADGTDFSYRISEELARDGVIVDPVSLNKNIEALTIRSRLTLLIDHSDEEELEQIIAAATYVLNEYNGEVIPQISTSPAVIEPIDRVNVEEIAPGIMDWIDLPLKLIVAFGSGLGLMLLVEYFDPLIRDSRQVQALELPLVASIPLSASTRKESKL